MIERVSPRTQSQAGPPPCAMPRNATCNDWGAVCYYQGQLYSATVRNDLEIYDRVGGG